MQTPRACALLLAISLGATACAAELGTSSNLVAKAQWADEAEPAWAEMRRVLAGRWQAKTADNRTIATTYRIVSKGRAKVVFTFLDATNVGADQSVMQRLTFIFRPDGFAQESVYKSPTGELESTTLHFVRADSPPAEE